MGLMMRPQRKDANMPVIAPQRPTESEDDDMKNSNTPSFKQAIEDHLNESLGRNLKFDAWMNHRQWELDGLVYVENKFTQNGERHTYKVRIGGDTIYFIAIDGETIYWDEEGEDKFIDENSKN